VCVYVCVGICESEKSTYICRHTYTHTYTFSFSYHSEGWFP
jgi:hypothetical protein